MAGRHFRFARNSFSVFELQDLPGLWSRPLFPALVSILQPQPEGESVTKTSVPGWHRWADFLQIYHHPSAARVPLPAPDRYRFPAGLAMTVAGLKEAIEDIR